MILTPQKPNVTAIITDGAKAVPRTLPAYVGLGDANEAIMDAVTVTELWYATPGAIEWLIKGMVLQMAEVAGRLQQAGRRF
jgi:hypothetical protein